MTPGEKLQRAQDLADAIRSESDCLNKGLAYVETALAALHLGVVAIVALRDLSGETISGRGLRFDGRTLQIQSDSGDVDVDGIVPVLSCSRADRCRAALTLDALVDSVLEVSERLHADVGRSVEAVSATMDRLPDAPRTPARSAP